MTTAKRNYVCCPRRSTVSRPFPCYMYECILWRNIQCYYSVPTSLKRAGSNGLRSTVVDFPVATSSAIARPVRWQSTRSSRHTQYGLLRHDSSKPRCNKKTTAAVAAVAATAREEKVHKDDGTQSLQSWVIMCARPLQLLSRSLAHRWLVPTRFPNSCGLSPQTPADSREYAQSWADRPPCTGACTLVEPRFWQHLCGVDEWRRDGQAKTTTRHRTWSRTRNEASERRFIFCCQVHHCTCQSSSVQTIFLPRPRVVCLVQRREVQDHLRRLKHRLECVCFHQVHTGTPRLAAYRCANTRTRTHAHIIPVPVLTFQRTLVKL